jgi:glycosyltransferase involved in cell wall biosynthesis
MSDMKQSDSSQQKSLCIVTQSYSFGGTEVHTLGVIKVMIERGYRVDIIACRGHREYDKAIEASDWRNQVTIIYTDLDVNDLRPDAFRRWTEILGARRGELLIFPKGENDMGNIAFLRACRRCFGKVVFIEHLEAKPLPPKVTTRLFGFIPAGLGLWWYRQRFIMKLRSTYADRIIAVSAKVKERLTDDWGVAADKVAVIRNGVKWQEFARDESRAIAFRARYGIPANAFIFGMATRLARLKAIDIALQALHLLLERNTGREVYLVIAGEGEQVENLTNLTKTLNLESRVKFVGFVNDARDVLSGYDVILFPSRREGLPLGLLEGMAAGCIPIVTNISGMPEAVNSPDLGWVVSVEDPEGLCRAMQDVLARDVEELAQMRRSVVRRIQEHFDIAECHRKIAEACGI